MGITETRSRGVAASSTAGASSSSSATTLPLAGELVQDRVARQRLEKRLKRRRAVQRRRQRQNAAIGCVFLALLGVLTFWGYRGWVQIRGGGGDATGRAPKAHDAKELAESFRRFQKDAPHAPSHAMSGQDGEPVDGGRGGTTGGANDNNETPQERVRRLEEAFAQVRQTSSSSGGNHGPLAREGGGNGGPSGFNAEAALRALRDWSKQVNQNVHDNVDGGIRFIRSYLLPPLRDALGAGGGQEGDRYKGARLSGEFKIVQRHVVGSPPMKWETEWKEILRKREDRGPVVDYTDPKKYRYPKLEPVPPPTDQYPVFKPLGELMDHWNHHKDYDGVFEETLMHFNYSNPEELEMAREYREKQLPFKLYDVPELKAAGLKWTDEYVNEHFSRNVEYPRAGGMAQESPNHYFAFFIPQKWDVMQLGLPPTVENDWSFGKWAEHARYADSVRLSPHKPHFYWQSGVPPTERHLPKEQWTFISRDLPSMSSPTETFFVWHPDEQKGIQCRFGERGVVAATHYDSGRNMVAMITGAKRYILSPPRACSKLGLFTSKQSPIYRHSLLNFAHIPLAKDYHNLMSKEERAWLGRASTAEAIDTVVKAGEVLYIPSFYFHYIVSLQKSAQCNVRSGVDRVSHPVFGGGDTVEACVDVPVSPA